MNPPDKFQPRGNRNPGHALPASTGIRRRPRHLGSCPLTESCAEHATQVETEWVPSFELPQPTPRSEADDENLTGLILDMKELAELPKTGLIASLRPIETAYRIWIKPEEAKLSLLPEQLAGHETAAKRSIGQCRRALERIKAGIDLIETNARAYGSFRLCQPRHVAATQSIIPGFRMMP